LRLPIAIQGPLLALQLSQIRMNRGAEHRGCCGSTLPITLRITAFMFLYPDLMIRKHSVKIRFRVSRFIELVATLWTNVSPCRSTLIVQPTRNFGLFLTERSALHDADLTPGLMELSRRRF